MDDGDVCLELLTTNQKNISFVTEVTRISADGMKVENFDTKTTRNFV